MLRKRQFESIEQWLENINSYYPREIELGLERVYQVAKNLNLFKMSCPVITVGGTNGKGSTVAGLEAIYLAAGYRVGAFISPFLYRFNELVRVEGQEAQDEAFIEAFQKIENARGEIGLTPFECHTLAALLIFQKAQLDVCILEVGLGGRLDAVNIIDADVSIVTSISMDHTELLGHTRDQIGFEKAGIFRKNKPAICGECMPPLTLISHAKEIGSLFVCQGHDFGFKKSKHAWEWWNKVTHLSELPLPKLALQNMSTVLQTIDTLQPLLPVNKQAIQEGLKNVNLPGRIEVIEGNPVHLFDVSHNPASAEWLARYLEFNPVAGKNYAVFSMLANKDISSTLTVMGPWIDEWFVGPLQTKRGAELNQLQVFFKEAQLELAHFYSDLSAAYTAVRQKAGKNDRVVVFGSFYTVAEVHTIFTDRTHAFRYNLSE